MYTVEKAVVTDERGLSTMRIFVAEVTFYDSTWEYVVSTQCAAFRSNEAAEAWAYSEERYADALLDADEGVEVNRASEFLFREIFLY